MSIGDILTKMWVTQRIESSTGVTANVTDIDKSYEAFEPFELGTNNDPKLKPKDRKTLYTEYKLMMGDPTIHAALTLLVTAALGGHESRGEVVFIRPAQKIRGQGLRAKKLRELVEKEAPYLQALINKVIFTFARNGVGYGDSYMRVYPVKGVGISHVLCDETVDPPLIQAYEQAGRTIGFHVHEITDVENRHITKLNLDQMIRLKMPRITPLPQFTSIRVNSERILAPDDPNQAPIVPSHVGGSFLQPVQPAWEDWITQFAALNSQQIADSVNNQFISMNVEGMPKENRQKYKTAMSKLLKDLHQRTKAAFSGGEAMWGVNWALLPMWGEKQVLQTLGDISKRTAPISLELPMTHLKRGMGALGLDLSLVGWMELITGGMGDGGAFHTSAQVMTLSQLQRQALTESLNELCIKHFAYKYDMVFTPADLPFYIEYYSDIGAAATESLNNKNTRANTSAMQAAALTAWKDMGLSKDTLIRIVSDVMGEDDGLAEMIATDVAAAKPDDNGEQNGI